jgi:cysteine desulfurase/selenocysteine lyase
MGTFSKTSESINLREEIVGVDLLVPLLDGRQVPYANLDNAASTPPFRRVAQKVNEAMDFYASVHRGSGFKSLLSTHVYDKARRVVAAFVSADLSHDSVIFVKNATEAINKLANLFPFEPGDKVLTTVMEHHSNDLPWRSKAQVIYTGLLPDGSLDVNDLETRLRQEAGSIKLVAVTGASNVSGYLPPIHTIAELAHLYGAMILVDCAQLLPHRAIDIQPPGTPGHLDFIAFSAHKVYAPFGGGALIGPIEFFNRYAPDYSGGGTVEIVTLDEVHWTGTPEKDEPGSPNVIGAIALAAALEQLNSVGMAAVVAHEAELTAYALQRLGSVQGLRIFGSGDPNRLEDRVGVIPFTLDGFPHAKLAAILSFEGGIGLRNGCFCAHPYVLRLLGVKNSEYTAHRHRVLAGDRSHLPGFLRLSFGCYNQRQEVDRLVEMLERVRSGEVAGDYVSHDPSGSYYPRGFELEQVDSYFSF